MNIKDMILNQYLEYTMDDLAVEEALQEERECNKELSRIIRRDAMDRLEILEYAKKIFFKAIQKAEEDSIEIDESLTFGEAIFIATGEQPGGAPSMEKLTQGFVSATDKIASGTVELVRTGAGKLGGWLTKFANKEVKQDD